MRRSEREIKSLKEIEEIIQKAAVCHLGLADRSEPYIVPVNFGYKDKSIYFHSAREGRKIDLIKKNNNVCFEMETDFEIVGAEITCNWGAKYRSVMGTGKAQILEADDAKLNGLKIITGHYGEGKFSVPKGNLDRVAVIKIDIEEMTGKKSGL